MRWNRVEKVFFLGWLEEASLMRWCLSRGGGSEGEPSGYLEKEHHRKREEVQWSKWKGSMCVRGTGAGEGVRGEGQERSLER